MCPLLEFEHFDVDPGDGDLGDGDLGDGVIDLPGFSSAHSSTDPHISQPRKKTLISRLFWCWLFKVNLLRINSLAVLMSSKWVILILSFRCASIS